MHNRQHGKDANVLIALHSVTKERKAPAIPPALPMHTAGCGGSVTDGSHTAWCSSHRFLCVPTQSWCGLKDTSLLFYTHLLHFVVLSGLLALSLKCSPVFVVKTLINTLFWHLFLLFTCNENVFLHEGLSIKNYCKTKNSNLTHLELTWLSQKVTVKAE